MNLNLQHIEAAAPDQASLVAAKKLLAPAKWQGQGFCAATDTAWGECQGSGSTPYYVVVDVADLGYKCSCPSRKFPCKHALALMWRYVSDPSPFVPAAAPDWVADWLGRRRKGAKAEPNPSKTQNKSIALTEPSSGDSDTPDPKKQAAAQKRAAQLKQNTDAQISTGLVEFVCWMEDQLRLGLGAFLDKASERCRAAAARLVDAKATNLAARVDELPSMLLDVPKDERAAALLAEFGRYYLLGKAWQKTPDNFDVRRAIAKTEDKETLLNEPSALAVLGSWLVVGERSLTRKDGLISHASYLVRLDDKNTDANVPNTALLLDFVHPSAGSRANVSKVGAVMTGRLIYYPSAVPFRAFFGTVETSFGTASVFYYQDPPITCPPALPPQLVPMLSPVLHADTLAASYAHTLTVLPWLNEHLHAFGAGRIVKDESGRFWYQAADETVLLKNTGLLSSAGSRLMLSAQIEHAFVLWDGRAGELLSVQSEWGLLVC